MPSLHRFGAPVSWWFSHILAAELQSMQNSYYSGL